MAVFPISVLIDPSGARRGANSVKQELSGVEKAAKRATDSIKRAFLQLGAALGAREIIRLADSFTFLQNQLRTVTDSTGELVKVTESLKGVANETRFDLQTTAMAYTRFSRALKGVVNDQKEVLAFTKSINQAIKISGATAQESRNGLIQFAQGLSAGALRGDEFRSVTEQLPVILDVLQERLGKTRAELREMAFAGQLTGELIFGAFKEARHELDDRFGDVLPTISDQVTVLRNNFTVFLGELQKSTKIFGLVGIAISAVNEIFVLLGETISTIRDVFRELNIVGSSAARNFGELALIIAGPLVLAIGAVILATGGWTAALVALAAVNPAFWIAAGTSAIIAYRDVVADAAESTFQWANELIPGAENLQDVTVAQTIWFRNALKRNEQLRIETIQVQNLNEELGKQKQALFALRRLPNVPKENLKFQEKLVQSLQEQFWVLTRLEGAQRNMNDRIRSFIGMMQAVLPEVIADYIKKMKAARGASKKFADDLESLRQRFDPLRKITAEYNEQLQLLFRGRNRMSAAEFLELFDAINESYDEAIKKLKELNSEQAKFNQLMLDAIAGSKDFKGPDFRVSLPGEDILNALDDEIERQQELTRLAGLKKDERAIELELLQAIARVEKQQIEGIRPEQEKRLRDAITARAKAAEEAEKEKKRTTERIERQKVMVNLAREFSDGLVDAALEADQSFSAFFSSFFEGIAKAIAKALLLKAILAATGQDHVGVSPFAKLFGFAHGGSFEVGGNGGTDSQLVAFRATPGETVEVRTPVQQSRAGGSEGETQDVRVVVVNNAREAALEALRSREGERVILETIRHSGAGSRA